jgi:uncharacterized membrane protein YkvA (DUF1232 family)
MIRALIFALLVLPVSWAVMIVLAARLPAGAAKDLASVLPACVSAVKTLRKDPRVPKRAKLAIGFAGLWLLSPIDLIPEFIPVIGPLDDILVIALAFRYAARQIPTSVLFDAWPADPRLLRRLIGEKAEPTPTDESAN